MTRPVQAFGHPGITTAGLKWTGLTCQNGNDADQMLIFEGFSGHPDCRLSHVPSRRASGFFTTVLIASPRGRFMSGRDFQEGDVLFAITAASILAHESLDLWVVPLISSISRAALPWRPSSMNCS